MDANGELLQYRHLIARPEYRRVWGNAFGKEVGRLAQGLPVQLHGPTHGPALGPALGPVLGPVGTIQGDHPDQDRGYGPAYGDVSLPPAAWSTPDFTVMPEFGSSAPGFLRASRP